MRECDIKNEISRLCSAPKPPSCVWLASRSVGQLEIHAEVLVAPASDVSVMSSSTAAAVKPAVITFVPERCAPPSADAEAGGSPDEFELVEMPVDEEEGAELERGRSLSL